MKPLPAPDDLVLWEQFLPGRQPDLPCQQQFIRWAGRHCAPSTPHSPDHLLPPEDEGYVSYRGRALGPAPPAGPTRLPHHPHLHPRTAAGALLPGLWCAPAAGTHHHQGRSGRRWPRSARVKGVPMQSWQAAGSQFSDVDKRKSVAEDARQGRGGAGARAWPRPGCPGRRSQLLRLNQRGGLPGLLKVLGPREIDEEQKVAEFSRRHREWRRRTPSARHQGRFWQALPIASCRGRRSWLGNQGRLSEPVRKARRTIRDWADAFELIGEQHIRASTPGLVFSTPPAARPTRLRLCTSLTGSPGHQQVPDCSDTSRVRFQALNPTMGSARGSSSLDDIHDFGADFVKTPAPTSDALGRFEDARTRAARWWR